MPWEYWITARTEVLRDGCQTFCPVEFDADGQPIVVLGFNLSTSLEDLKKSAKKVFEVDNLYEGGNPKVLFERGSVAGRDSIIGA